MQFDFWSIGGFWVGVGGILAAIIFYHRGKHKKILGYHINSTTLLTQDMTDVPGLKVTIYDEPITNLISTSIRFKNKGNQEIMPDNFPAKAKLMIITDGKFFGCRYTSGDKAANLNVEYEGQSTLHIKFDYLDVKSGFTVTIWHTGIVLVTGKLINGEIISF